MNTEAYKPIPDLNKDKFEYYFRPGRNELLDYFFN